MRITLTIDDDVVAGARALARRRGVSPGSAVSDLARLGLGRTGRNQDDDRVPVFGIARGVSRITSEDVQRALGDWL